MAQLDFYMARKSATLEQRQTDYAADPTKALVSLSAVSRVAGITGVRPVRLGEHAIVTDSAPGLAGHAIGPSAPELLLGALASCLVHTYLIQAALGGVPVNQVEVEVRGEIDMRGVVGASADYPTVQNITYEARLDVEADDEVVARLHHNVERSCPVLNTLRYPVSVARSGGTAVVP